MMKITIKDRPCGWGKTTEMMKEFKNNKGPFLCVVPSLSECDRVIKETTEQGIEFHQPGFEEQKEISTTKSEHLEKLIAKQKNIVCTHELYYRIGRIASATCPSAFGRLSPLSKYNLVIDEVVDPFNQYKLVNDKNFRRVYLGNLVEVKENGLVVTTEKWDELYKEGVTEYPVDFYDKVKSLGLYYVDGGLFIMTVPLEMLKKTKSVQVLTFLSEGSFFRQHIQNLIEQGHSLTLEIDTLPPDQLALWKKDVRNALTIFDIPSLSEVNFSFNKQTSNSAQQRRNTGKKVSMALYNLGRRGGPLVDTQKNRIMITCAKSNWYGNKDSQKLESSYWSKGSRLFGNVRGNNIEGWTSDGAQFVPNTTRGTNKFSDCSHAIYLYDQHPNPQVVNFLGFDKGSREYNRFIDDYALTELIQWLFRSSVRRGGYGLDVYGQVTFRKPREKTAVFIPCNRMRTLLENWLDN